MSRTSDIVYMRLVVGQEGAWWSVNMKISGSILGIENLISQMLNSLTVFFFYLYSFCSAEQKALPQISATSKNATIKLEPPERESFSSNKKIQVIKQETVDPNLATEILQRLPRTEAIKYTRIIEARQKVLQEQDVVFLDDIVVQGIENEPENIFAQRGQEVVEELEVYEEKNTEANLVNEYIIEDTEVAVQESQENPNVTELQESEEIVEDSGEVFEEILELPEQEIQEVVVESTVSPEDPDKCLVSESEESFIGFSGTENPEGSELPETEIQEYPALKDISLEKQSEHEVPKVRKLRLRALSETIATVRSRIHIHREAENLAKFLPRRLESSEESESSQGNSECSDEEAPSNDRINFLLKYLDKDKLINHILDSKRKFLNEIMEKEVEQNVESSSSSSPGVSEPEENIGFEEHLPSPEPPEHQPERILEQPEPEPAPVPEAEPEDQRNPESRESSPDIVKTFIITEITEDPSVYVKQEKPDRISAKDPRNFPQHPKKQIQRQDFGENQDSVVEEPRSPSPTEENLENSSNIPEVALPERQPTQVKLEKNVEEIPTEEPSAEHSAEPRRSTRSRGRISVVNEDFLYDSPLEYRRNTRRSVKFQEPKALVPPAKDPAQNAKEVACTIENLAVSVKRKAEVKPSREIKRQKVPITVTCGRCQNSMPINTWQRHLLTHNGVAWQEGREIPIDMENETLIARLIQLCIKKNRLTHVRCEKCGDTRKSGVGLVSHERTCGKSAEDIQEVLVSCEHCSKKILPCSLRTHQLNHCSVLKKLQNPVTAEPEPADISQSEPEFSTSGRIKRKSTRVAEIKFRKDLSPENDDPFVQSDSEASLGAESSDSEGSSGATENSEYPSDSEERSPRKVSKKKKHKKKRKRISSVRKRISSDIGQRCELIERFFIFQDYLNQILLFFFSYLLGIVGSMEDAEHRSYLVFL